MSRFFGTASDSDTESDVSEEEVQQRPTAVPTYTVCILLIWSFFCTVNLKMIKLF